MKCHWCNSELTVKDVVISDNNWAYCKKCKKPMLDTSIQSPEHFLKQNEGKIEHDNHISLLMQGYM